MPSKIQEKKKTISVVLATFNEEKNIAACLRSVQDWVDEIVVVDEESTDNTQKIAKKLGAKVFSEHHHEIFHITKNIAINKASSDWILQLDADERVTPALRREIEDIISGKSYGYDRWVSPLKIKLNKIIKIFPVPQKLTAKASAYWIPRKNFFLGRYLMHTAQYPDPVIRLFQKGKAVLPAKDVHEQMLVTGVVGWLGADLDHKATPTFDRYLSREDRYSTIHSHQLFEQGVKISLFNTINYLYIKPLSTFISLYIRHRGFQDGFPGFVFSLYSGFHHAFSYMKLWEIYKDKQYQR